MIDAMFQAGTDTALDDQVRRPSTVPPPGPGLWKGSLSAIPRGVGSAVAKSIAFGSEITGAFGEVLGAYPEMLGPVGDEQRAQSEAARRKLLTKGIDFSDETGDLFRQRSKEIMPDPNATGAAAHVLAGLSEFMTQAVGYTLTLGPVGPLALGGDVGLAEADRLKQLGVDPATRTQAGTVAGVLAGGSIVVPMSGATALSRFGKGVAVGEGTLIGQAVAEKLILKNAGYDKIADTFDPFDPVALAMGLVPGVIGAKFGRPVKTEAQMKSAAALTPAEQARSDAFEASAANIAELERAIKGEKNAANRLLLVDELERQRSAATDGRVREAVAAIPDLVPAARVQQSATALMRSKLTPDTDLAGADAHVRAVERAMDQIGRGDRVSVADVIGEQRIPSLAEFAARERIAPEKLAPEVKSDFLGWLAKAGGVDVREKFDITGERSGVIGNPGGIFRKGGHTSDIVASLAEEAGYLPPGAANDSRAAVEMIQAAMRGDKVLTMEAQMRNAAREQHAADLQGRIDAAETRLRLIGVDPAPAKGNVKLLEAYERQHGPRILAAAVDEISSVGRIADTEGALPPPPPSRAQPAIDRAKLALEDLHDSDKTLAQFVTDNPLAPEVHNLLIGMSKADAAGQAKLLHDFDAAARRNPKAPLQDLAADAVETQGKAAPERSALERAAEDVATLNPDMLVQLDSMAEPVRVADLLEAVKREAENDLLDGRLVEAAAACAVRN